MTGRLSDTRVADKDCDSAGGSGTGRRSQVTIGHSGRLGGSGAATAGGLPRPLTSRSEC
jgi:hypothetical protein